VEQRAGGASSAGGDEVSQRAVPLAVARMREYARIGGYAMKRVCST